MIKLIEEGVTLVDSGPLYATIKVLRNGVPLSDAAVEGAQYALKILEQQAEFLPIIKKKSLTLKSEDNYPPVVKEMIWATQLIGDPDFTPLAAVAGATSDLVADYLLKSGATKIVVNNGGDIAIRLREGERVEVGLCLDLEKKEVKHSFSAEDDCGICTSGIGGRSFTLGVANAVVVLAKRASLADAAATYLGNKTNVESPRVRRDWAENIYPDTDIPGMKVTVSVGELSEVEIQQALESGKNEARRLMDKGIIHGAVLAVKGSILPLGVFKNNLKML